jgi:hypothetical protein
MHAAQVSAKTLSVTNRKAGIDTHTHKEDTPEEERRERGTGKETERE